MPDARAVDLVRQRLELELAAHRATTSQALRERAARGLPSSPTLVACAVEYDFAEHRWLGFCPYGDFCSGCDAAGYCSRAELHPFGGAGPAPGHVSNSGAASSRSRPELNGENEAPDRAAEAE